MVCKNRKLCDTCGSEITMNNYSRHVAKCTGLKLQSKFKTGRRGGWNKGLTLLMQVEQNIINEAEYNRILAAASRGGKNSTGNPTSEDAMILKIERCRENAIKNHLGGHTSKVKLHYLRKDGTSVYLQSSYEIRFATILDELGIDWSRPSALEYIGEDGRKHRYYPDFKVKDIFIDTKNDYLAIKDKPKIDLVRQQCRIDLRIVTENLISKEYIATLV